MGVNMIRGFKTALMVGAAWWLTGITQTAHAQETQPSSDPTTADIIVTGTHASEQRAVQIKKQSAQIIDTVSASEIGQLPDFNAGDALRRVTGVNTLTYQGEPRFVTVRGFPESYNDILIDGFSLASVDINLGQTNTNGRQISMEVLPSNIASHIDVVKSALPSNEGGFIGGLTNFVTASAFDFPKNTLTVGFKGGESLDTNEDGGNHFGAQAEVAGAARFGADREFGIYISGTYWKRQINVPQIEAGGARNWYDASGKLTTPYGGTGFAVPSQRLSYNYQNERDRLGLQSRLDYRPSDAINAYIAGYYFKQNEDSHRNDLNAAVQAASTDLGQTATTGTLTNVTQTMQLGRYIWHRAVYGTYGRLDADLGGNWRTDAGASWSHSRVDNPQTTDSFAETKLQYNYDTSGATPLFTPVSPMLANNLALYPSAMHREERYRLDEDRYDIQANLGYNAQAKDRGFGFLVGARYNANRQNVSLARTTWTGLPYTLASVVSGSLCGYACDTPIPTVSPSLVDPLFAQYKSTATSVVDLAGQAGGTYATREDIVGGYAQAQLRTDHLFVAGGIRVERTHFSSNSTQVTNGVYAPVGASTDYTNVLPSLSVVLDTSETSKLRFAASETVSRPGYGQASFHGGVLTTTSNPPTFTTGNPNLQARRSINLDLGHDWYLDHGRGILSIATFYKWIKHDIFTYGELDTLPGVAVPVLVTEARNTDKMVRAYGVEVGFSHDLNFLPAPFDGFGVSANATFARAHFPVTLSDGSTRVLDNLPEQASRIFNASLYYDKGRVHGRFAWNHLGTLWDDRFPNFTPAGFYANRYQQPTDNFDLQLSFDVTRNISVSFDALNLTHQGMQYRYGVNQELLQSTWKLPTQILFGARVKL